MVWPEICCGVGSAGGGESESLDFMPSLKPRTAPPRSWPMLRSFFVPKISTTTSSTISQCQMLNPPMVLSSRSLVCPRQHRAEDVRAADHVHVQMHHILPADATGIDDGPIAVGRAV